MTFECKNEHSHHSPDLVLLLVNTDATGKGLGQEACTFCCLSKLAMSCWLEEQVWLCCRAGPGCARRGPRGGRWS